MYQDDISLYNKVVSEYLKLEETDRAGAIMLKKKMAAIYDRLSEIKLELRKSETKKGETTPERERMAERMKLLKEMYIDCRAITNRQVSDYQMDR